MVANLRTAMGAALFARTLAIDLSILAALSRMRLLPHPPRELTVLRVCAREDVAQKEDMRIAWGCGVSA